MGDGVLDTLGLAATLVFAVPVAILGADLLLGGSTLLGAGFLAVAALMVAFERRLTRPSDVPVEAAERVASVVAEDADARDSDEERTDAEQRR